MYWIPLHTFIVFIFIFNKFENNIEKDNISFLKKVLIGNLFSALSYKNIEIEKS